MLTSVFFKEARATQARESRKSPASTATCSIHKEERIKVPNHLRERGSKITGFILLQWITGDFLNRDQPFTHNTIKNSATMIWGS